MKNLYKSLHHLPFLIVLLLLVGCAKKEGNEFIAMSTPDMIAAQRQLRDLQLSDPHRPT